MTAQFDLSGAADELRRLVRRVEVADLSRPTPCELWTVCDLANHLLELTAVFTDAARKTTDVAGRGPTVDDHGHWKLALDQQLVDLATAWKNPSAWRGETRAGPLETPAPDAAVVALDELVLHGWDLARSIGARHSVSDADLDVIEPFVASFANDSGPAAADDLFAPPLPARPHADRFEQILIASGRDPEWAASAD